MLKIITNKILYLLKKGGIKHLFIRIFENFFKPFIPPICFPDNFYQFIDKIFNYKKSYHVIKYDEDFFKRHAFINKAISKFDDCKYLEIGVDNTNDVFNSIPLKKNNKYGVDPFEGGNLKSTSDDFFKNNSEIKFDVIFIDGLHEYNQCKRDLFNSINQLNNNGIIFLHDLLPRSENETKLNKKGAQMGDIWKIAVELQNSKNLEFKIGNIDCGIGILKIRDNFEYVNMPELKNCNFKDYLKYYKNFPLIGSEEALDFIDNKNI